MTTLPSAEPTATAARPVLRFDRVERWLHWSNATLVLVLVVTGTVMYVGPLSVAVGRRTLVEQVHLWAGLAVPVPFALALAGPWGRGVRADARRLGRFLADDWLWLRARHRRSGRLLVGKFNGGQKLNAVLVAGALPVLFGTGVLLQWNDALSDGQRSGATLIHDWGYLALTLLVAGHVVKALRDPHAMRAMRTGWVAREHVRAEHPRWEAELAAADRRGAPADPLP